MSSQGSAHFGSSVGKKSQSGKHSKNKKKASTTNSVNSQSGKHSGEKRAIAKTSSASSQSSANKRNSSSHSEGLQHRPKLHNSEPSARQKLREQRLAITLQGERDIKHKKNHEKESKLGRSKDQGANKRKKTHAGIIGATEKKRRIEAIRDKAAREEKTCNRKGKCAQQLIQEAGHKKGQLFCILDPRKSIWTCPLCHETTFTGHRVRALRLYHINKFHPTNKYEFADVRGCQPVQQVRKLESSETLDWQCRGCPKGWGLAEDNAGRSKYARKVHWAAAHPKMEWKHYKLG